MFGRGEGGCQGNNEPCLAATVVACRQHDVRMLAPVHHFVELVWLAGCCSGRMLRAKLPRGPQSHLSCAKD